MELEKYIISKKYGRIYFKIDEDDYNKIINEGFKISISNYTKKHPYLKLYKKINNKKTYILLHRFITKCPKDKVVDHINHDTLDNRKSNLRICTPRENSENMITIKTGYVGITLYKPTKKWRAGIYINNKGYHIGYYNTIQEAVNARNLYKEKVLEVLY